LINQLKPDEKLAQRKEVLEKAFGILRSFDIQKVYGDSSKNFIDRQTKACETYFKLSSDLDYHIKSHYTHLKQFSMSYKIKGDIDNLMYTAN
jgi:hypothetical protein